jgi:putative transcriptional regulator
MDMKQLRQAANLKAEEVALRVGVAISTVRNWEQGKTTPRLRADQFGILLSLYRCNFDELLEAIKQSQQTANSQQ